MLRTFRSAAPLDVSPGGADLKPPGATKTTATVELPAHLYPPENSTNVSLTGDAALGGAIGAQITPIAFQTPQGRRGIFRTFGIFVDAPLVSTRLRWTVRVGGLAVNGLENVTFIPRAAGSFSRSVDVLVISQPGQLVEVVVTNDDGAPIRAGATLDGWMHLLEQGASNGVE